ncbi:MAG: NAD-dependent DNA ligase LigA [Minisyncoccota bacterium]
MDKKDAKERIGELKRVIEKYRYAYHVLDKSLISDEALDSLKKELFDLENEYPEFVTPDSPTQRVGGEPLKEFKKVEHEEPMISLNDAFSVEDMNDWIEKLENYLGRKLNSDFYCELKLDGFAVEFLYEDKVFKQASTRGNGLIGEDITQNIKTVEAVPLKLDDTKAKIKIPKRLVVRGEVFVNKKEFNRMNEEQEEKGLKTYANPRNLAAGSVRQLDPKITAGRKLDSFEYDIIMPSKQLEKWGITKHEEEHELLKSWGFKINPHNKRVDSLEEIFKLQDYWTGKKRDALPYEIDGIVVFVNDNKEFERAGVIGKAPRGGIAFKFSPKEAVTIIEGIKIQVGRTGVLTPVAILRPVQLAGITITHATLHNFDEIQRLGVRIGDTVIVSRAGDVIPKILKVLKELRPRHTKEFEMPRTCPIDGGKVIKEGVFYKCGNKNCGGVHKEKLYHFVSRGAFNIEGLGPKIIDRFIDEGLINDAADIFDLKEGDILTLERFGKKSAENIVKEVNSKKEISLNKFIYSLGIIHIGEETSVLLAEKFLSEFDNKQIKIINLLDYFRNISIEKLQEVQDIGPKVAQSVYDWFHENRNLELLKKMEDVGIKIKIEKKSGKNTKLNGLSFVLTGSLETMERGEAKERIRELGGDVSESVSKNTSYVVVGAEPGSKAEKAKKLGVKILNEKEFLDLVQ